MLRLELLKCSVSIRNKTKLLHVTRLFCCNNFATRPDTLHYSVLCAVGSDQKELYGLQNSSIVVNLLRQHTVADADAHYHSQEQMCAVSSDRKDWYGL